MPICGTDLTLCTHYGTYTEDKDQEYLEVVVSKTPTTPMLREDDVVVTHDEICTLQDQPTWNCSDSSMAGEFLR